MKHINTYRVFTLAAALAVTAAASLSCAKQETVRSDGDGSIGYSASIAGTKVAEGDLVENLDKLKGKGFGVSAWYTANSASYFTGDKVSWDSGSSKWTSKTSGDAAVTRIWPANGGLTFLAATPAEALENTANTNIATSTWTYTHSVGTSPAADDLLFGYFTGTKSNGTVDLTFHHPLALLEIRCGSKVTGISSISEVSVSGLYASGTYTMNYGAKPAAFSWAASGSQTITQTLVLEPSAGTLIGESLPLIPQAFTAEKPVVISLKVTGLDDAHKTFVCTLNNAAMGSLAAGKKTTVSINIENADRITFEVGVTAWGTNDGGSADAEAVGLLSFDGVALDGWQNVNSGELDL